MPPERARSASNSRAPGVDLLTRSAQVFEFAQAAT